MNKPVRVEISTFAASANCVLGLQPPWVSSSRRFNAVWVAIVDLLMDRRLVEAEVAVVTVAQAGAQPVPGRPVFRAWDWHVLARHLRSSLMEPFVQSRLFYKPEINRRTADSKPNRVRIVHKVDGKWRFVREGHDFGANHLRVADRQNHFGRIIGLGR